MELAQYQNYEEYKKAMNTVLNRTVEDFVMTGYLLKQGRDTDILKDSGYFQSSSSRKDVEMAKMDSSCRW